MYDKRLIQQMVVDEMQDSVKIDGKSIPTASKSVSSSNELPPSSSTCRDWHNHYEKYNELKIDTTHFYNTLASSVRGTGNGFFKSVNWTEEKTSFLVAILNENPEFYLDKIVDAYFKQTKILLHPSIICCKLLHKLMKQGYRLKNYSERAKQQNEADRAAYMKVLHLLVRNPSQVLLIDETHKDNRSSRRSRAWGKVGHEVVVDKWFHDGK
jgi:hypothetical protein